jgi:hypothetical protein
MAKRKKNKNKDPIKLNLKKPWEVSKGHTPHKSGAGTHDNRPRKQRTRKDRNNQAIKDQKDN